MLYQTKNPHGGDIYDGEISLDFSANTNPFGTPQGVLEAVSQSLKDVHRYPDPYCRKLVQAISRFEGVPQAYILCGNGAAELIYAYCEALHPETAAELAPTFSEYALGLARTGCVPREYVLSKENGFQVDRGFLDFLKTEMPQAVFLCNPNNPTGQIIEAGLLKEILTFTREKGIHLFVDECFLDLSEGGESLKGLLEENPQLFLLKAFTKSYGMAGIRLGYCMSAAPTLLEDMSQTVQPWNVSGPAQSAGIAALQDPSFLPAAKKRIRIERAWLQKQLEQLGFWVCPSQANFILFHGDKNLHSKLAQQGILIRNCANYYGLDTGWYRIAVRLHHENETLISALKQFAEEK